MLYIPQPSSGQFEISTADSGRKSVQASPGTSSVWLMIVPPELTPPVGGDLADEHGLGQVVVRQHTSPFRR